MSVRNMLTGVRGFADSCEHLTEIPFDICLLDEADVNPFGVQLDIAVRGQIPADGMPLDPDTNCTETSEVDGVAWRASWAFSRDLLVGGLSSFSGDGDVFIHPEGHCVIIYLRVKPDTDAFVLHVQRRAVEEFLRRSDAKASEVMRATFQRALLNAELQA